MHVSSLWSERNPINLPVGPSILEILLHLVAAYDLPVYCKRGYFRWGKISRKCWQDISRGGNFHNATPISFIKAYGFYFRVGVIFAKKTKAQKRENYPHAKISTFTVLSSLQLILNTVDGSQLCCLLKTHVN